MPLLRLLKTLNLSHLQPQSDLRPDPKPTTSAIPTPPIQALCRCRWQNQLHFTPSSPAHQLRLSERHCAFFSFPFSAAPGRDAPALTFVLPSTFRRAHDGPVTAVDFGLIDQISLRPAPLSVTIAFLGELRLPADKPDRFFKPKQTPNARISADCGPARQVTLYTNLAGKA